MATYNAVEYGNQVAVPPTPLDPTQDKGRVRIAHFDFTGITSAAIGDLINLIKLPAGKVRILKVCIKHASWATSSTLSIGHTGYTLATDKSAVAAAAAAFLAATAMNNTTDIDALADVVIDSTSGFTLTGTIGGAAAGSLANSSGWVEYVVD